MERTVGPYRLGESLGATPFGELVAATHPARSEPLAVLILDERLAEDYRFRGLLRLEIARAGGVRHPAIARAVEVGEHDGAPYVVVERPADGVTLARAFAEGDPPAREETVALVRRLAEGLDAAHGRRLVHGAIGPSSVLVGPSGSATLVGLAVIGAVDEAGLSAAIAERTEAAFTAPEQREDRRAVALADGYALGVLAAALLRVKPPPAGPADPIGNVLARQCAADPTTRYPTCAAFAAALAEALAPAGEAVAKVAAAAAPSPTSTATEPPESSSDLPTPLLAAGATSMPPAAPPPGPSLPSNASAPVAPVLASAPSETPRLTTPTVAETIPVSPAQSHSRTSVPAIAAPVPATPPSSAVETAVTPLGLTPAMAAMLEPPEARDVLGDAIAWGAAQSPALDEMLDRYCLDGKVGPLPLGLAAAGALALLLLVAGQIWPASVVVMVCLLIYGVPRLGAALSAPERANARALRVTGPARLDRRPNATSGTPGMTLANLTRLSVRDGEFDLLAGFGTPATIQRSAFGAGGVHDVVVGSDLPAVTVTYLTPGNMLLDVRDPDSTVLYRRPPYQGEPGDRLWAAAETPTAGTLSTSTVRTGDPSGDDAARLAAPPPARPAAAPPAGGPATVLPIPPAARQAIRKASTTAAWQAGAILGAALIGLGVLSQFFDFFGFVAVIVAVGIIAGGGGERLVRALQLWGARQATSMTRVVGPAVLSHHTQKKSHRYRLHLDDGTSLKIDAATHGRLAREGEAIVEHDGWGFDSDRYSAEGYLRSEHRLPSVTVTYEPTVPQLLEIVDPSGATLYRDPALREGDLGRAEPQV
jgi:serine/threonine protein kinase